MVVSSSLITKIRQILPMRHFAVDPALTVFAALDRVEPGGTVQFAPGTYLIGEIIRGCVPVLEPVETRGGGYLVVGNTFRASVNGIRTIGQWREPAVIRGNDFVDTFHAVVVHGSTVHVLDNDISAPDPARVPTRGYPGGALLLSSTDLNRSPGASDHEPGSAEGIGGAGGLESKLIEGNRIMGAEGLGIDILRASRNRIVGNTIRDVRRRDPFPGVSVNESDPVKSGWEEANGSAIRVSPGSDGNEIVGNTFEEIAGSAVVIQGDSNRVERQNADDAVRDLGTGNRISGPGGSAGAATPPLYESRFVEAGGIRREQRQWKGICAGREAFRDSRHPHIRGFVEDVALARLRAPAPARRSQRRE
jgi:hypothetical protein